MGKKPKDKDKDKDPVQDPVIEEPETPETPVEEEASGIMKKKDKNHTENLVISGRDYVEITNEPCMLQINFQRDLRIVVSEDQPIHNTEGFHLINRETGPWEFSGEGTIWARANIPSQKVNLVATKL